MGQKSRWPLPQSVPLGNLCVIVPVPNELYHIGAFLGAMFELAKPYSWANDNAHTAISAAAVWRDIFNSLKLELCSDFICSPNVDEWEDFMSLCESLRFNPATGLFEGLCCGTWTTIPGQPAGGLLGSQPASGAAQPVPGQCVSYQVRFKADEQWLLPAPVN